MFICGSGSFGNQDEDHENESNGSPCPTPKRSKRSTSFCKILGKDNTNKNPYADRGLDKFYALLADLDDKKQKIYTQMGSEDISFVRFVYKNDSNHVKPIVVKLKEKNNQDKIISSTNSMIKQQQQPAVNNNQTAAADKVVGSAAATSAAEVSKEETKPKKKRCLRSCSESFKMENMRHPFFYFPVIVVLILLFLAVYGRSFAILCTSIGWYMMPTVVGGSFSSLPSSSNERKPKRKKEYVRRQSEKKIVLRDEPTSPKSVINGP